MDISSMSGYLSSAMQSASDASSKAQTSAQRNYAGATEEEMLDACKKFEAYFIEQVLKEVKKTIPQTDSLDGPTSSLVDFFKDGVLQDLSEDLQETQNFGLAQQMFEQMKRNYSNIVPIPEETK